VSADPFTISQSALDAFIQAWEIHTLPKAEWTHAAHVAVCAYYHHQFGPAKALSLMRERIPLYNVAIGGQNTADAGYHETLTILWCQIVAAFLAAQQFATPLAAVRAATAEFGADRKRHELYYTFDVVRDQLARRQWVPPDKQPQ
jgi:hypothetical protein